MPSLYENLDNAHDGEAMTALGDEFGLTPTQTQAAVTALLPAISTGLKQSTATVDGLGNLFGRWDSSKTCRPCMTTLRPPSDQRASLLETTPSL
jgi:hypothetical protein